jgi:hypothetical protein
MPNVKIPRKIGVKVSKKVRKKVRKAVKAAANPFVRDFATAAMAAAGRARRDSGHGGAGDESFQPHFVHIEGSKVAEAFRAAAVNGLRTFLEGLEEGLRKAESEPPAKPRKPARPKAPAKPKAAARPKAARPPRKPRATGPSPAAPGAAGG